MSMIPTRGNSGQRPMDVEEEIGALARTVAGEHKAPEVNSTEHPALIACRKAADMVRSVHEHHSAEGETLAQHLEQIGQNFFDMCKQAAEQVRSQRILPKEMASKMADELLQIGKQEADRQATVARGLTAARDAILGIDKK